MAPGRVFAVDANVTSPWARWNVGAVLQPAFAKEMRNVFRQRQKRVESGRK